MLVPEVNDELCPFHCTAVRIVPHEPCVTQDLAQERKGTPGLESVTNSFGPADDINFGN